MSNGLFVVNVIEFSAVCTYYHLSVYIILTFSCRPTAH